MSHNTERGKRVPLWLENVGIRILTVVTDAIPPRYRFGHWNRVLAGLAFRDPLPAIESRGGFWHAARAIPAPAETSDVRCMLVVGSLDKGGIETVVAALAQGLPAHGVGVEVVCSAEGYTAGVLRERGVEVSLLQADDLPDHVLARRPDVIQLHRVETPLLTALRPFAQRTVPVFHAIESYIDRATWTSLARITADSPARIAVSHSVAGYFKDRLRCGDVQVVVNGVPDLDLSQLDRHRHQRDRLGSAVGVQFRGDDIIVVSLQRFSDQKNSAGLVDAFLLAAESNQRLHLVIAGSPDNWLEVRRSDILRRRHRMGDRVHFLGSSDALALLLGGDVFALDSYAEGGPVVAVEAISCGLPTVLSDVGFARELLAASRVPGRVVNRANAEFTGKSMARQRRRRHQANRAEFARALLLMAQQEPRVERGVPEAFTERNMIAEHARILREAASA